nr:timeless [Gampsocleis gratiosa]
MEWMLVDPLHVHGAFPPLGMQTTDSYEVSDDCLDILNEILDKLSLEDRTLRTYRRALGYSQVIKKELLPLMINIKNEFQITDTAVRILVNLTIPVECLLPMKAMLKTDVGRHSISDINYLLMSVKEAFVDVRSTRAVVDHMKFILEKNETLTSEECESINNCLLLLRNVLHVPEPRISSSANMYSSMQNQILWNLFAQNIDKVLVNLMTSAQKASWGVSMVQLIALMYKDQHVGVLQKLLNLWFEASLSESSEDNESNTSPPEQGSGGDSSPMLTSDPTSDSSDNGSSRKNSRMHSHSSGDSDGGSGKQHSSRNYPNSDCSKSSGKGSMDSQRKSQSSCSSCRRGSAGKSKKDRMNDSDSSQSCHMESKACSAHKHHMSHTWHSEGPSAPKKDCPSSSELSDYGYATQVENQESVSTSSNEDECMHSSRPVHQKHHSTQKTRYSGNKCNITVQDKKEWRRKKLVKRSKTNVMNMKALLHHTPTDEDISNLLKEFTVDFLLKGYGCLVHELHSQLLNNSVDMQVDTSHFFWLVTYFLKFATQLEIELEHISPVLCFDIISYLIYEGVSLCEELELSKQQKDNDVTPCLRRMHLVVTAIREFIQAVETYKKLTHLSQQDRDHLLRLQLQIGSTEDLKCLFVLLLRQYNPSLNRRQHLQDLIVTNHILLLFLDNISKLPEYRGSINMLEHIKQFATVEVMHQYGLLLEDFESNGEFINNCIFTMMHHIGGDMEQVAALFQPNILKTFGRRFWETDFDVCDDWADLIEYVINKFINTPKPKPLPLQIAPAPDEMDCDLVVGDEHTAGWTKDDLDHLYWFYEQSLKNRDTVGKIKDLYEDNGVTNKSRLGIIHHLFTQDVISHKQFDEFMKSEALSSSERLAEKTAPEKLPPKEGPVSVVNEETSEMENGLETSITESNSFERISVLRDYLLKEKKGKSIIWLQKSLIEACYVKLNSSNLLTPDSTFIMEPVPHHYNLMKQSIPVVPWSTDQKNILLYQPFILLLHKLGFHLPVDSGKLFVRIPNFWTPDVMFSIAQQLGPIDKSSLKFDAKTGEQKQLY